jgi:hypothetical protein
MKLLVPKFSEGEISLMTEGYTICTTPRRTDLPTRKAQQAYSDMPWVRLPGALELVARHPAPVAKALRALNETKTTDFPVIVEVSRGSGRGSSELQQANLHKVGYGILTFAARTNNTMLNERLGGGIQWWERQNHQEDEAPPERYLVAHDELLENVAGFPAYQRLKYNQAANGTELTRRLVGNCVIVACMQQLLDETLAGTQNPASK